MIRGTRPNCLSPQFSEKKPHLFETTNFFCRNNT